MRLHYVEENTALEPMYEPSRVHTFTRALKRAAGVTTCQSARTPKRLKVGWDELCSQLESITESSGITVPSLSIPLRGTGRPLNNFVTNLSVTFDPNYCPVNKEDCIYTEVAAIKLVRHDNSFLHTVYFHNHIRLIMRLTVKHRAAESSLIRVIKPSILRIVYNTERFESTCINNTIHDSPRSR